MSDARELCGPLTVIVDDPARSLDLRVEQLRALGTFKDTKKNGTPRVFAAAGPEVRRASLSSMPEELAASISCEGGT